MPGRTPISVPSKQPKKPYRRFWKVKATPKPMPRLWRRSMQGPLFFVRRSIGRVGR
jgi:hypothetical protein